MELAARGLYGVAENPRVGCVIVRDGAVIGRGWHKRTGGPHAEVNAIRDAGGDVRGATVYVSLEPCCHTGRQPPCVSALIRAGVARVVVAMRDPDARVAGRGIEALREAGIVADVADSSSARALNAGFVQRMTAGRPLVRIKLAASLDGRTALASGESQWITSPAARADVQHWRARSSAIVTGIGTVLADAPRLTVRDPRFALDGDIRQPAVAVADSRARTPSDAELFAADRPVWLFAGEQAPTHPRAVTVRHAGATVDLAAMLRTLGEQGCNEVLVEAGATLAGAFFRQGLWDEAIVYLAPKVLGDAAMPLARLAVDRLVGAITGVVEQLDPIGGDIRVLLRRKSSSV